MKEVITRHDHVIASTGEFGFSVSKTNDGSMISFAAGPAFKRMLTSPQLLADGRTEGGANRDAMHEYLQGWIDGAIGPVPSP